MVYHPLGFNPISYHEEFDMSKQRKIYLSFLLVILLTLTSSSSALSQVDPQSWIKRRLTYNAGASWVPSIAVWGNNVHVVWYDDTPGNREIFYKRSSDNGATWSKSKRLTKNAGFSSHPVIAVSGNTIHVAWSDNTLGNDEIHYKRSTNNGATWRKTKRLTKNAGDSVSPAIAVSGGNIHVVWYDDTPGNVEIFYKRSADNGATWGAKKRITHNAGGSYNPDIAVSEDRIHVAWTDESPGNREILYRRSSDNGATWGKKRRLTNNAGDSSGPTIAVSGGNVHLAWYDDTPGNDEVFYKHSNNNGAAWRAKKRLTHNAGDSSRPEIVVSGSTVHMVWVDGTPGNSEIFYKRSDNNGTTWGSKKRLSTNIGFSSNPETAVWSSTVHVVWVDDTPGNAEIFYKRGP
jgi:hypothetical protein